MFRLSSSVITRCPYRIRFKMGSVIVNLSETYEEDIMSVEMVHLYKKSIEKSQECVHDGTDSGRACILREVVDEQSNEAAIVDPVEPETVINAVKEEGVNLTKVLTTHHHWDHAGGNNALLKKIKVNVYGGDKRVEGLSHLVSDGETLKIGNLDVSCLATPCHTTGHVCYHIKPAGQPGAVFTGDTLFIAGCGRFFEGTPSQMYSALIDKLGNLPDETKVYCGHEYTCANLKFAETVEPTNPSIQHKIMWAEDARSQNLPTVPSTIGEEKTYNPFMRVVNEEIMNKYNSKDPITVMKLIRAEKDNFKA